MAKESGVNRISFEVFRLVGNIALNGKATVVKGLSDIDNKSEKMKKRFQEVGSSVSATGRGMTKWVTGPIVAVAGGLTALAKKTADYADIIDKTSQRMGMSAQATQEWKFVGEQLGVELTSLERGLSRFQKRVGEADDGLASAKRAFETLNIEIQDSAGNLRNMDDLFPATIKKLAEMEDVTKRNQLAMELFGRGGKELIPILNQSSGNIEDLTEKAHELGIVMDDDAIGAGVEWTDTLHEITEAGKGLFRQLGNELIPIFLDQLFPVIQDDIIPILSSLIGRIGDMAAWFGDLDPPLQKFILGAIGLSAALGPIQMILGPIISAFGTLIPLLWKGAAAIAGISAPALGTAAAIAGLVTAAILVYNNWQEVKSALGAIWEQIKAQAENMSIGIQVAFLKMKQVTLNTIDAMLEKLGVLESLPFGIGDKFKGMKDAISDSADGSAAKIEELQKKSEENDKRIAEAAENMGVSFGDAGKAIADDVSGIIDTLNVFSVEAKNNVEDEVDFVVDEYKYETEQIGEEKQQQNQHERERSEEHKKILEKIKQDREDYLRDMGNKLEDYLAEQKRLEEKAQEELFQLRATDLEKLEKEFEEKKKQYRESGADITDLEKAYQIRRQEILEKQAQEEKARLEKNAANRKEIINDYQQDVAESNAELQRMADEHYAEKEKQTQKEKEFEEERAQSHQETLDKIVSDREQHNAKLQKLVDEYYDEQEKLEQEAQEELFQLKATELEKLDKNFEEKKKQYRESGADITDLEIAYQIRRQQILDDQAEKEKTRLEKNAADREQIISDYQQGVAESNAELQRMADEHYRKKEGFEQKWSDKLFQQTATREEILEEEKKEALRIAEEKGADTTDILRYYANEEKKILDEQEKYYGTFWENVAQHAKDAGITIKSVSKDIANSIVDMFDSNYKAAKEYKNKRATIKNDIKSQIDDLEKKRQEELKNVGDNVKEKEKINKKYDKLKAELQQAEKDRLDDTEVAYEDSRKSIKDVLKDMLLDIITMLEKQILAYQIAEQAKALIAAPLTFGATLLAIPAILAATVPSLLAFEGLKAGVRAMAEGALVEGPTVAMIGEGPESEAVLPLNKQVFAQLAQGITQQMPQQQVATGTNSRSINVNFYDAKLMSENDMDIFMNRAVRYIKDVGGLSNDQ